MRKTILAGVAVLALAGCQTVSVKDEVARDIDTARQHCAAAGHTNTATQGWLDCMHLTLDWIEYERTSQQAVRSSQALNALNAFSYGYAQGNALTTWNVQPQFQPRTTCVPNGTGISCW